MTCGLMLGGENSEFQVIVFLHFTQKCELGIFLSPPKLLPQKTWSKFVLFLSKPRVNKDFNNFVKDALSEFLVIFFGTGQ